ncbi:MAG: hypothetical protein AAB669_01370 [Patescibacteria group bacterium]
MFDGKWIHVDQNGVGWEAECYQSAPGTVYDHQQTNYRQMPVVINNYCCPIPGCNSQTFEAIYEDPPVYHLSGDMLIGPGPNAGMDQVDRKRIKEYRCPGCTTRFEDPSKFSKNKPAKIVIPVATLSPREKWQAELRERLSKEMRELSGGRDCNPEHRLKHGFGRKPIESHYFCELCGVLSGENGGWGALADPCPASAKDRRAYDKNARTARARLI